MQNTIKFNYNKIYKINKVWKSYTIFKENEFTTEWYLIASFLADLLIDERNLDPDIELDFNFKISESDDFYKAFVTIFNNNKIALNPVIEFYLKNSYIDDINEFIKYCFLSSVDHDLNKFEKKMCLILSLEKQKNNIKFIKPLLKKFYTSLNKYFLENKETLDSCLNDLILNKNIIDINKNINDLI